MRIWSLHPSFLDSKGLVALWRETLLARKVLLGMTKGYRHHPQLDRFKASDDPVRMTDAYLTVVAEEAMRRGFRFDTSKFNQTNAVGAMTVTKGQLMYETRWLKTKLQARDPDRLKNNGDDDCYAPHPLFRVTEGGVEKWEKR